MKMILRTTALLSAAAASLSIGAAHAAAGNEVTLIHMGDIHGHLVEHPNLRSDGKGAMMGGLARMYTKVRQIRAAHPGSTITVNGGDTVQGSAEALFTSGQAVIDVLNKFDIDVDNPGNWDYLYGTDVFLRQFAGARPQFRANAIAANLYYDGAPYQAKSGERVLNPYWIKHINGLKVGFIGYTAGRGPQAVKTEITRGLRLTDGEKEFPEFIHVLRNIHKVDIVVVISELGLAPNVDLANRYPGVDVILSSDMHEMTAKIIRAGSGTLIVDEGQDGQVLNEMTLRKRKGKVSLVSFRQHRISADIRPDAGIAALVAQVRAPFVAGPGFVPGKWVNPLNGVKLMQPIDTVVGHTEVPLYRSNFADEEMPAVIEGSSHDFLADAFRAVARSEVGIIRGFRYGTHVAVGPITRADLYHYIPIGPMIARGTMTGHQLRKAVDDSANACLATDVAQGWTGGWMAGMSGATLDLNPFGGKLNYTSNFRIGGAPLDEKKRYSVAGYYYQEDPHEINRIRAHDVEVLKDKEGNPMDAVEVVVAYLDLLPNHTVTAAKLPLNRFRLVRKLPGASYGNREMQPLNGVPAEPLAPVAP